MPIVQAFAVTGNTFLQESAKVLSRDMYWTNRGSIRYNKTKTETYRKRLKIPEGNVNPLFSAYKAGKHTAACGGSNGGRRASMNRILRQLFDYQRFEKNRTLQQVIDFILGRYTNRGMNTAGKRQDDVNGGREGL